MAERLLAGGSLSEFTWVEFPGDWAALYYKNDLRWEGHPGDFEWSYHLDLPFKQATSEDLIDSHAPLEYF